MSNPVNPSTEKEKAIALTLSGIEKQFGKGSIMRLGEDVESDFNPDRVVSTGSISLDIALGVGGLPRGRVVEIYGPESSGKTTLALQVMAQAQKKRRHLCHHRCGTCLGRTVCKKIGTQNRGPPFKSTGLGRTGLGNCRGLGAQ